MGLGANTLAAEPGSQADPGFRGVLVDDPSRNLADFMSPADGRVAVPLFRMGFVLSNGIAAETQAGTLPGRATAGSRSTVGVTLQGVDLEVMQRITDHAYEALQQQLRDSGRDVVPARSLQKYWPGFKAAHSSPLKQYTVLHKGRTVLMLAPTGMPLVLTHLERAWGDAQVADEGNYRRLVDISSDMNAVVMAPIAILDFVKMRTTGYQTGRFAQQALAGAELSMRVEAFGSVYLFAGKGRRLEGIFEMLAPQPSPMEFGTLVVTSRQVNGSYDLPSAAPLNSASPPPGGTRTSLYATAQTTNSQYFLAATDAVQRTAAALAKWLRRGGHAAATPDSLRLRLSINLGGTRLAN